MSHNINDSDTPIGTGEGSFGSTGTTDTGIARTGTGTTSGGAATGTAPAPTGIGAQAKEVGQKVADAASHAREFITEKASVVGDKIQDLRNVDYGQLAEDAKQYARQRPGQALIIAAATGFVIGLLLRGSRR
jgi:ElaB/YqjD/DUF883 family membrane-anchored ribosome-binding protein